MADYFSSVNVKIYACPGELSGTYEAGTWDATVLWEGALCFPHASEDYLNWATSITSGLLIGSGNTPSPTANYRTLQSYVPQLVLITAVANGAATYHNTSGQVDPKILQSLFPRIYEIMSGIVPGGNLHVVTKEGSKDAYAYTVNGRTISRAVYAQIQRDGSLVIDPDTKLALPRLGSDTTGWIMDGCFIQGITEDGVVSLALDYELRGNHLIYGTTVGRRITIYPLYEWEEDGYSQHLWPNTAAFLTKWLHVTSFDHNSFVQGFRVGSIMSRHGRRPQIVTATASGTGSGTYHEESFLSGMAAGYTSKGV